MSAGDVDLTDLDPVAGSGRLKSNPPDSPVAIVMAAFPGSRPATEAELAVLGLHRQAEAIRAWNAWQRALEDDGPG